MTKVIDTHYKYYPPYMLRLTNTLPLQPRTPFFMWKILLLELPAYTTTYICAPHICEFTHRPQPAHLHESYLPGCLITRLTDPQITIYALICEAHSPPQIIYIYIYICEPHWYRMANKDCTAIYAGLQVLNQRCRDNAHPAPTFCTSSCNESSGRSVGCAANY